MKMTEMKTGNFQAFIFSKHEKKMKGGNAKMDNRVIAGILILGIIALGVFLSGDGGAVVSAQGDSVIEVEPDEVSINLNLMARDDGAQAAKDKLDKISDDVYVALILLGLDKEDIKLQSYNIYPDYKWINGNQQENGFVANQYVVVTTENFDLVPGIVDASVDNGALVSYINFELSEEKQDEYKIQALEEAGKDAKAKAEATASGLGKKLGKLVSVRNQDYWYGPYMAYESSVAEGSGDSAKTASYSLSPQDVEVRASISVEYKLRRF